MRKYIIVIVAAVSLASCTERIDLDLNSDENQRLVVDALFTDEEKQHEVILTLTSSYFDNEPPPVATGAVVTISSDAGEVFTLTEVKPGYYLTNPNVKGEVGRTYTLRIDYNGETYNSVTTMKRVPPIDTITQVESEDDLNSNGDEDDDFYVALSAQEPAGIGDYYMWEAIVNGVKVTDTLGRLLFVDDGLWDGQYVEDIALESFGVTFGDTVDVYMMSISKAMNDFLVAANLETNWRGGIFDGPPANLPSMISNGAIGFFSASAVSPKRIIIKKP